METDTILLKEKLDFHQYQLAVKALSDIGIEVEPLYNPYAVYQEDKISIEQSREDFKNGRIKDNEQVLKEVKQKYESILGWYGHYELEQTLSYWTIHNMSTTYSDKIHAEVVKAINDIKNNPDFSGRYITELRAYQKIILKGKFSLYWDRGGGGRKDYTYN